MQGVEHQGCGDFDVADETSNILRVASVHASESSMETTSAEPPENVRGFALFGASIGENNEQVDVAQDSKVGSSMHSAEEPRNAEMWPERGVVPCTGLRGHSPIPGMTRRQVADAHETNLQSTCIAFGRKTRLRGNGTPTSKASTPEGRRSKASTPEGRCPNLSGGSAASSKASTPERCRYPSLRSRYPTLNGAFGAAVAPVSVREAGNSTPEQRRRSLYEQKKSTTPERNWRASHGSRDTLIEASQRKSFCTGGGALPQGFVSYRAHVVPSPPRMIPAMMSGGSQESVVEGLLRTGFLSEDPIPWMDSSANVPNDLAHVREMFMAQVPNVELHRVYRTKHDGHSILYNAVQDTMESTTERILWHGTHADSVRNITLNGFNRNYCGRHGMKFGYGTYFSAAADYSVRFCDKRSSQRFMFLAKVLVGSWTKGTPDMREPPFRDSEGLMRFDSTTDSSENPNIFCIFRDYQAVPLYVLEFSSAPS